MWIRASLAFFALCCAGLTEFTANAQPRRDGLRPAVFSAFPPPIRPRARKPAFIIVSDITKAQAVRAAIRCNRGGEALKAPVRKGSGFVVKVLKGSYVRFIHVDKNGQCG